MAKPKRITVGSKIYAKAVYPRHGSDKSADAKEVNILMTDDEALNLARHLVQAARCCKEMTLKAMRIPSTKKKDHHVPVTYEPRMRK